VATRRLNPAYNRAIGSWQRPVSAGPNWMR
jgi:hypothetical protein